MLTKLPSLNQVPQELLDTIPELANGQMVTFRSLIVAEDLDAEFGTKKIIYPVFQIPTRDIIRWKKDENSKLQRIAIGVPAEVVDDKVEKYKFFCPGNEAGVMYGGRFSFTGGNVVDEEMYIYLMLSNFRKGNPNKDKSIPDLYELIDFKAMATEVRKTNSKLRQALNLVDAMTDGECDNFAASMNWPYQIDKGILKADIESFAHDEPDAFLENFTNKGQLEMKSFIKKAEESGLIKFNTAKNQVMWVKGNAVIATIEKEEGKDWLTQFADWCKSSGNGPQVYRSIKSKINNSKEDKSE